MKSICLAIVITGGLCTTMCSEISAQGLSDRNSVINNSPYQLRLSPYLDLMRDDRSVLPPYHSFVRPRQELRQRQNRQAAQIGRLGRAIGRSGPGRVYSSSPRLQTGRGGTFYNTLHFFPSNQTGQR